MDSKLLLVQIICLLYWDSHNEKNPFDNKTFIKELVDKIKSPETTLETDHSKETIYNLKSTVNWLLEKETPVDKQQLLQRLRIDIIKEDSLYSSIETSINQELDEVSINKICINYQIELRKFSKEEKVKNTAKELYRKLNFEPNVNFKNVINETIKELESFNEVTAQGVKGIPGVLSDFKLSDKEELRKMFDDGLDAADGATNLKTGWQGLNRMLGHHEGIRRGTLTVVGALQHNFKSGFCNSLFVHTALYNKPVMLDEKKKPCLLLICAENAQHDNVIWMYQYLYEVEHGIQLDIENIDRDEATEYLQKRLSENGYEIRFVHINPTLIDYQALIQIIVTVEAEGYEIHMCLIDYLNMINKAGLPVSTIGSDVRYLLRSFRNFCMAHNIAGVTPHQLSTEAKKLVRQGTDEFVKLVANKGYWDSCGTIDQEVDLELYIHIEIAGDGFSYLTVQRGKHRGLLQQTKQKDLFATWKFQEIGTIPPDLNGKDTSMKKPGGTIMAEGGEDPWFMVA